jgi:RNA polymerase sigma-70 factor (ECF subfamily)
MRAGALAILLSTTHNTRAVVANRPLHARCGQATRANKQMPSHVTSRRRIRRVEMPEIKTVSFVPGSDERVISRSIRPAAPDEQTTQSPETLLQACASGDQTALHSLYKGTAPQLFGLALRILRSRETAEEIIQDCFVLVWRNAHTFDPSRGAAMAWLARIVRNRCIDVIRRRGREAPLDDAPIEDREDPASRPADQAVLSCDARRLQDCLDKLEEGPRNTLKLIYYEGMTYQEVAAHVGVPLGTVKSWVRRSLIRLRGCLER